MCVGLTSVIVLHSGQFVAAYDDLVGRAPWPAADPLVGHLRRVHSSLWLRLCCLVGRTVLPSAGAAGAFFGRLADGKTVRPTIFMALFSLTGALHADVTTEGRDLYNRSCTTCHGLNGAAGDRAPALAAEREYLRTSAEDIFEAIRHGIPGSLMPASSLPEADIRKVVAYIRSLRAPASDAPVAGDVSHGEAIFRTKGRCLDCHMLGGRGGLLGPDLSDIGAKRSLSALRAALTQARPNTVRGYQAARVVTTEGKALTGIVKNENNFSVQFLDSSGGLHLFTREELREITYQKNSVMPGDYDRQLTSAEMQDLLAFLSRPKDPE